MGLTTYLGVPSETRTALGPTWSPSAHRAGNSFWSPGWRVSLAYTLSPAVILSRALRTRQTFTRSPTLFSYLKTNIRPEIHGWLERRTMVDEALLPPSGTRARTNLRVTLYAGCRASVRALLKKKTQS